MLLVDTGLYFGIDRLLGILPPGSGTEAKIQSLSDFAVVLNIQNLSDLAGLLEILSARFVPWVVPFSAAFFVLFGLILWFVLKGTVSGLFKVSGSAPEKREEKKGKESLADKRLEQERKRRIFLHFLSVLQREGRLLDFFNEDLDLYEDEQIGAAVRSIQEDCKKVVNKYLAPKPVIDREEGDEIDIEPGFDPDSVKLTGNVTGEPPFKGILRHRGWKTGRKEMPTLSDVLDSSVIVPAEVEIE
ncbi:MAG: DUF2760 domain-containing protein [Thermodesulfobacteriota bacterium]|nr:DUF2760 domain-containing protein [Thermodesulfobacteriota bacterium]